MSSDSIQKLADELCAVCQLFGARLWCLATSGNFSARIDTSRCLITQSGKDKSRLQRTDLMICDMDGNAIDETLSASAETLLHTYLYARDQDVGAVLHTHSVAATVASNLASRTLDVSGYEMQKAFRGIVTHEARLTIPVFDNAQDMSEIIKRIEAVAVHDAQSAPGFLIRGHGLYAFGRSIAEAQQHIEGLEFLLQCILAEDRI